MTWGRSEWFKGEAAGSPLKRWVFAAGRWIVGVNTCCPGSDHTSSFSSQGLWTQSFLQVSCRVAAGQTRGGLERKMRCPGVGAGGPLALDPRPLRARLRAWSRQPGRVPELWTRECSCGTGDARSLTLWPLRLPSHFRCASQTRPER